MRPVPKSTLWKIVTLGLVMALTLAFTLVIVGCGSDEVTTTTAAPTTATMESTTTTTMAPVTTTAPPTTSPPTTEATTTTTEALSSAEIRLADGTIKGMGFIDKVWVKGGVRYLSIDYAEMLTGEEARQAAIEDGVIQPGEYLDNDYYIRNQNTKKREFTIATSVEITTATRPGGMDEPATWEEFLSFWGPTPPADAAHLKDMPWWIIRDGAEVFNIAEQYIP